MEGSRNRQLLCSLLIVLWIGKLPLVAGGGEGLALCRNNRQQAGLPQPLAFSRYTCPARYFADLSFFVVVLLLLIHTNIYHYVFARSCICPCKIICRPCSSAQLQLHWIPIFLSKKTFVLKQKLEIPPLTQLGERVCEVISCLQVLKTHTKKIGFMIQFFKSWVVFHVVLQDRRELHSFIPQFFSDFFNFYHPNKNKTGTQDLTNPLQSVFCLIHVFWM